MPHRTSTFVFILFLLFPQIPASAAELLPISVQDGQCKFVVNTEHPDDQFLLVLGSLAKSGSPYSVTITAERTDEAAILPLLNATSDPAWQSRVADLAARQARARMQKRGEVDYPPVAKPPSQKIFHLFVKGGDFQDAGSYATVTAELRGVGKHCQVYVDQNCIDRPHLQALVGEAIHTFDDEVHPRALGAALDVDRDGRFTILFSGWLAKMTTGQTKLSGFVRGTDFYRELAAPLGNRCDMLYLSADLQPGPFLRSLIAHEYTHAVIFSEHVFGDYLPGRPRLDEESWLNEAIAHVIEDIHGHSWANLDYRISAFLNSPSRYALVVPDYYGSNIWRDPGPRGGAYLFLRWCVDRFGPELLTQLVQSNLNGIENLEVATQTPFAELFRQWSAALAVAGTGIELDGVSPLTRINVRDKLGTRLLCGPRFDTLNLSNGKMELKLAPTSFGHVLLHSPTAGKSRIMIEGNPQADLQVSLIRLPRLLPRLELTAARKLDGDITLSLTAHHAAVTLEEIAWERVITHEEAPGDTGFIFEQKQGESVRGWPGETALPANATRCCRGIAAPAGELVFRAIGRDKAGRRIAGWALIP